MPDTSLRDRYTSLLLERFRAVSYPSTPMMDRLEASIVDRGTAEDYVNALLEHVEGDEYPSPEMLDRINRLIGILERSSDRGSS